MVVFVSHENSLQKNISIHPENEDSIEEKENLLVPENNWASKKPHIGAGERK